jgi:hypothetical protein
MRECAGILKRGWLSLVLFVTFAAIISHFFALDSDLWISSASSACAQRLRVEPRVQGIQMWFYPALGDLNPSMEQKAFAALLLQICRHHCR